MRRKRISVGSKVTISRRGRSGIWTAEYHFDGQHRRKSLRTLEQKVAIQRAAEIDQALQSGWNGAIVQPRVPSVAGENSAERPTLASAIDKFMAFTESKGTSRKTIVKYRGVLQKFAGFVESGGIRLLYHISATVIDNYMSSRRVARVQDATLYFERSLIKSFLDWCVRRDFLSANPIAKDRIKKPKNKVHNVLTCQDISRILSFADEGDRLLILALAMTGMRSGELRQLRLRDVDLEKATIEVVSRDGAKTKTGLSRNVPIHPDFRQHLERLPKRSGDRPYFCDPRQSGARKDERMLHAGRLNDRFGEYLRSAGLPVGRKDRGFTIHSLRHFFKTHALECGVPRHYVDTWQGHATGSSASDAYVHPRSDKHHYWMSKISFGL